MTINKYLSDVPDLKCNTGRTLMEELADTVHIWSNDTCKGYAIIAMQAAGFTKQQITEVLQKMCSCFSDITNEEAEQAHTDYLEGRR